MSVQTVSTEEMTQEILNTLCELIEEGSCDDQLRNLKDVVRKREKAIASSIKQGDRIRITGRMNPQYSIGATAIVQKRERKGKKDLFWVTLEPNQKQLEGKKFNHTIGAIGLPVENVEKIS
tara:strand:- start:764 stop:1126 length:363 start_codon:yes stop_codon:yes gene_type:complete